MSAEYCGAHCGWCSMCDADFATRCATQDCDNAVSLPEWDTYCTECRRAQALRAKVHQFRPAAQCVVTQADYEKHWRKA